MPPLALLRLIRQLTEILGKDIPELTKVLLVSLERVSEINRVVREDEGRLVPPLDAVHALVRAVRLFDSIAQATKSREETEPLDRIPDMSGRQKAPLRRSFRAKGSREGCA